MERKTFIKGISLFGLSGLIPQAGIVAKTNDKRASCVLIPSETEGPYPLMSYYDTGTLRSDIRESQVGSELRLKLKIIGVDNCLPIQNALVYIWHCNNHGYYSGYPNQPGYLGTKDYTGATWLRGVQMTDSKGEVNFMTNFPGWYTSRVTHIHFRVYLSSVLQATSQLSFPVALRDSIQAGSDYSAHGADPLTPATDSVLKDGFDYQIADLTAKGDGTYDSYLEVAINGSGKTGLLELEPETGGQFKLGQNYPNPCQGSTIVPYELNENSAVELKLIDLNGREVKRLSVAEQSQGKHEFEIDFEQLSIPPASYIYVLTVINGNGSFTQGKMLTYSN